MPRFEQYPLAESLPQDAILLFADPNDLVDGNPKVKRFPASFLPQELGVSPSVYDIQPAAFSGTNLPSPIRSGDVINFTGPNASTSIPFFGFSGQPPQEGTIIIMRNERPNTVVTIQHSPNEGTFCVGGTNVVLEGSRLGFVSFYVRRNGSNWSLRQIGGGFY